MDGAFGRFLSVEIVSDAFDPIYKVKFIERVEDRGAIRFEKREGRVPRSEAEELVGELIRKVKLDAR
jgi:hypothetical protein